VLLIAGGAIFGLIHAKHAHSAVKALAVAAPVDACSGVERDLYRQAVDDDPSTTLAEVRSEVHSSGIDCVPDPEIAAELKDLTPACRDMVQYTFFGVRSAHADIKVGDVRERVVEKSVACERDRASMRSSLHGMQQNKRELTVGRVSVETRRLS
jgi:hypothetical protein